MLLLNFIKFSSKRSSHSKLYAQNSLCLISAYLKCMNVTLSLALSLSIYLLFEAPRMHMQYLFVTILLIFCVSEILCLCIRACTCNCSFISNEHFAYFHEKIINEYKHIYT